MAPDTHGETERPAASVAQCASAVETYDALAETGAVFDAVETWADDWLAERPENPCLTDG